MSGFKCLECGKKFRTVAAAERAASNGCPRCGGVDIDVDVEVRRDPFPSPTAMILARPPIDPPPTPRPVFPCHVCGTEIGWDSPSGVCSTACLRKGQGFPAAS
jgi:hypothetical protein